MIHAKDQRQLIGQPIGLFYLFFTELWERFSYYGMRALLVLYLTTKTTASNAGLGWSNIEALQLYGWYTALVYIMSIPGGFLADRVLGQKKAVMIGGLILCAGHLILAVDHLMAFFAGLILIILGVGLLKPNISSMVGGLYERGDIRRDKGFAIFYIGINIGAVLAGIIVGSVAEEYGWHYGFGLAGIGMGLGQIVYMRGQKYLHGVGESIKQKSSEDKAEFNRPLTKVEKDRVIVLILSFLIVVAFFGAFEQAGGLMNLYAQEKINRLVTSAWSVPAAWFQSANALFIILFSVPIASFWIWMKRKKKESSSLFKMAMGMVVMALGFLCLVIASTETVDRPFGKGMMVWLILAYLFHTLGELCLSPVSLSFVTKLAPKKFAALMMGLYFAATGFGNLLAAKIGEGSQIEPITAKIERKFVETKQVSGKIVPVKTEAFVTMNEGNIQLKSYKTNTIIPSATFQFDLDEKQRLLNAVAEGATETEQTLVVEYNDFIDEEGQSNETFYQATFRLLENEQVKEYNTFMGVFIYSVVVALLVVLLLKRLKKLTHGVEEEEVVV